MYVCLLIDPPFHFSETFERKVKVIIYKIRRKKYLNSMNLLTNSIAVFKKMYRCL